MFRLTTGPMEHVGIVCVDFYYHMYGASMGALQFVLEDEINSHVLWSKNDDQGNLWKHAQITVNITDKQQNVNILFLFCLGMW